MVWFPFKATMLHRFKSVAGRVVPSPLHHSAPESVAFSEPLEEDPYDLPDVILLRICSYVIPYSTQDTLNILCSVSEFFCLGYYTCSCVKGSFCTTRHGTYIR